MPQLRGAGPDPECEMRFRASLPAGRVIPGVSASKTFCGEDVLRQENHLFSSPWLDLTLTAAALRQTSPRRKMGVFFSNLSLYGVSFPAIVKS